MDMSFSLQALAAKYIKEHSHELEPKVYRLPDKIDRKVAEIKLRSMGIKIDELTEEQKEYLRTWKAGT
jgi:adenosylhomocysteinase